MNKPIILEFEIFDNCFICFNNALEMYKEDDISRLIYKANGGPLLLRSFKSPKEALDFSREISKESKRPLKYIRNYDITSTDTEFRVIDKKADSALSISVSSYDYTEKTFIIIEKNNTYSNSSIKILSPIK